MSVTKPHCDSIAKSDLKKCEKRILSYNDIATKLLEDRFLLTALELHTELVENGRELKVLRDFFSNPGNFELQIQETTSRLSRSGSQVTLDSLDLTRYSEDGAAGDERVAVLEFELRKAKETINALRNNLTFAIESESSTPDKGSLRNISFATIKPHEQRALNFLINEYLLLQGYKLTSITFADENQNQDFDDWDDVGLNISKPPELLHLYREGLKQSGQNGISVSTQTDFIHDIEKEELIKEQEFEIEKLKSKLYITEADVLELKSMNEQLLKENKLNEAMHINLTVEKAAPDTKCSETSDSPERFEIIDKNMPLFKKNDLEDTISNNSFNVNDWTSLSMPEKETCEENVVFKELDFSNLSSHCYVKEVFSLCYLNIDQNVDSDIIGVLNQEITLEVLVHIVSQTLLNIIPNIILNKREEVIPLLMASIYLNPKASERDKLLQQLFNLKKKPTESERLIILTGIIGIAKYAGEQLVENEILPQCWLQLTHKYLERRLLVAEACTVLIPYVSNPIRNSLILSMLQQMLEDKEDPVREQIVKALALLFSTCDDKDKYNQCEQIALNTLNDSSNSIINLSTQILFPVLARWALKIGILNSSLLKNLLHLLNNYIKNTESQTKLSQATEKVHRVVCVIDNLLPFLLISVAFNEHVISNIEKDISVELRSDFVKLCTPLTNPVSFHKTDYSCGTLLHEFDKYILENPNVSWTEMDWMVDIMLPDLFNNLHHVDLSQQSIVEIFINLFSHIYIVFGKNFTRYKIRPILQKKIQNLEQVVSSFNQFCPSLNIIPIYLTALIFTEDYDEVSSILKKFLCVLPLCGTPLDSLDLTVRKLCECGLQELVVDCLWSAVVHQRPLVKSAAASLFCSIVGSCNEELLKSKVTAAIVTLASDNDMLVRTATLPALGSLVRNCRVKEIHDKAYMQLQTFTSEPSLKENHSLLRQLIVTLGDIVNSSSSSFRNDIILPQLVNFSIYMSQMTNQTRKVDLALALIEAFTHVVYSPLNKQSISSAVKAGLKSLETVISENQSLSIHYETVLGMIKECENKSSQNSPISPREKGNSATSLSQNVNQGVEEMRQRVSKIFHKSNISKPNTLPNIQGIFKKK